MKDRSPFSVRKLGYLTPTSYLYGVKFTKMKDNKHIQSFNEHQENLNISDKMYKLIENDPQFNKPGGGLFSPPIGTIAKWNWKHDLYLFGNGEIGNWVCYVNRNRIENNPKWVKI